MIDSERVTPFSLFLFVGLALKPLPLAPLQTILNSILRIIMKQHHYLFTNLYSDRKLVFLIDPIDFPCVLLFEPTARPPVLLVLRDSCDTHPSATIAAPLDVLFNLLTGKIDGDAMFFSRSLTISGDTQAVVALNNALDSANIDLSYILASHCGPLAGILHSVLAKCWSLVHEADVDLRFLGTAILSPLQRHVDAEFRRLREFNDRLTKLEKHRESNFQEITTLKQKIQRVTPVHIQQNTAR